MDKLPKWCLTDSFPAVIDTESKTVVEQTARVYGAMQSLIDEYNKFADNVNAIIEAYEAGLTEDNNEFRVALRQEFQDFIDIINLKVMSQDKEIADRFTVIVNDIEERMQNLDDYLKNSVASMTEEIRAKMAEQDEVIANAVSYMRDNITETVTLIINGMLENGEISDAILEGFENLKTQLDEVIARVESYESDITTIRESIGEVIANYNLLKADVDAVSERLDNELNFENTATGTEIALDNACNCPLIEVSAKLAENSELEHVIFRKLVMRGRNIVNFKNAPDTLQGTIGNVVYTRQENGTFTRIGSGKICQDAFIFGDGTLEGKPTDLYAPLKAGETYYIRDCFCYAYNPSTTQIVTYGSSDAENNYNYFITPTSDEIIVAVRFPNTGNGTSYNDVLYPMIAESEVVIPWEEYDGHEIEIGTYTIHDDFTGTTAHFTVDLSSVNVFGMVDGVYCLIKEDAVIPLNCSEEVITLTPANNSSLYAVGEISGTSETTVSDIELTVNYYNNSKNGKRFGAFHKCAVECSLKE